MQAEVDVSCRSIPGFVADVVAGAVVSMIKGHFLMNTAYWGEIGSTYLEEAGESSLADWLGESCFRVTNLGAGSTGMTPVYP